MATIRELLVKYLPEEIADKAIANCTLGILRVEFREDEGYTPLEGAFVWGAIDNAENLGDWSYWHKINEDYFKGKDFSND